MTLFRIIFGQVRDKKALEQRFIDAYQTKRNIPEGYHEAHHVYAQAQVAAAYRELIAAGYAPDAIKALVEVG